MERLSPLLIPALEDDKRLKHGPRNLYRPTDGGRERSGVNAPRETSVYTAAQLHPGAAAGIGGAVALGAFLLARRVAAKK